MKKYSSDILENFPDGVCLIETGKWRVLFSNKKGPFSKGTAIVKKLLPTIKAFVKTKKASTEETITITKPKTHLRAKMSLSGKNVFLSLTDVTNDVELEQKMFQRSEELSILYELGSLSTQEKLETIIGSVVSKLTELTGLEYGAFAEMRWGSADSTGSVLQATHNYGMTNEQIVELEILVTHGLKSGFFGARSIVWGKEKPPLIDNFMKRFKLKSLLSIPVHVRGKLKGLMFVASAGSTIRIRDNARFFDLMAGQLSGALERAQLFYELEQSFREIDSKNRIFSEQLELAQKLQTGILQIQFPKKPQIDFAIKYVPSYHLGGDFYDIFEIVENKIGVLIADVCGHGVSSALITTFLKAAARDLSIDREDPAALLTLLNNKLVPVLPDEMFVSAFFMIFDLDKREVHFSNAGHPLPIYYDSKRDIVRELEINGLVLSLSEKTQYITQSLSYSDGDRIFLFTDGLYEITNAKKEFLGVERVQDIIQQNRKSHADEIVAQIMTDIYAFANRQELDDDLNLIGIDLHG